MKQIEDQTAIRILKTIARTRLDSPSNEVRLSPDIAAALRNKYGDQHQPPPSECDLARAALDLLYEDPVFAGPIRLMANQSELDRSQKYIEPSPIALIRITSTISKLA